MADLQTLFPQVNIDQMGYLGGMMQGDMFNIAKQNNQINQQGNQAEQQRLAEMHPLDMAYKQAQIGYQTALGRQANASANKSIWELEQNQRLQEPAYKAALAKFLQDTNESEVKQAHAELEKQLMSPDPQVRAKAQQLYKGTGDMLKMYEQQAEQRKTQFGVASITAQSREAVAKARQGVGDFWSNLVKNTKGDPTKMRSGLIAEATRLQQSDPEAAAMYLAQAKSLEGQQDAALAGNQPSYVLGPDGRPVLNDNAIRPKAATPGVAPAAGPQTKKPTTPQEAQQAGWKLMVDKNGNRAYVGPNKEIMEVK